MKVKLFITLLLLSNYIFAQDNQSSTKKSWEITAMLRKGLDTKDDKDKPAQLSLTWPQDGKDNSYLVNAAMGLDFIFKKTAGAYDRRIELIPTVSFNRNNQIKKEQHNQKLTLAVDYLRGRLDNANNAHSYLNVYPTLQYMNNKKDSSKSFLATAYFTWILKTKQKFLLNNYQNFGSSPWLLFIGPAIGFEYQDRFDVKKPAITGNVLRFYFNGDVRIAYKAGGATGFKRFELTANYTGREGLSTSLPVKEGYLHFFKSELSYFPVNSEAVSLGLSYNDGEDPVAAIEKQKFWQLAFKLKLDYPVKK